VPARAWTTIALRAVVAMAVVAIGYVAVDRYVLSRRSAPGSAAIADKSLAVLPFADLSEKHDQEYLADGLADELLDTLARIPNLKVISRTSSYQFKDKSVDLRDIGAKLGAAHIVEGSVRRFGDHVRVTAQLIRTSDGVHEWSGSFDRQADDALHLQTEIATALGRALEVSVVNVLVTTAVATTNPAAHDYYLHGMHAFDAYTADGEREAAEDFQRAIDLDPAFVSAHEMLGLSRLILAATGYVPPETGFAQVRSEAEWLLQHDPQSVRGHSLLGRYHTLYTWNWSEAEREAQKALAVRPDDWGALYTAADLAMAQGHLADAEHLFKASLVSDPLDADSLFELAGVLRGEGKLTEAVAEARRGMQITPNFPSGPATLGLALMMDGRTSEALAAAQQESDEGFRLTSLCEIYFAMGRKAEAMNAVERAIANHAAEQATNIAVDFAFMKAPDRAFEWLERAYRGHDAQLIYLKSSPEFSMLRSDQRYSPFVRKMHWDP
jgi:adenylate cyclase